MVTVRTLVGIAGFGGMVIAATGLTLHNSLQQRVRDSYAYKEGLRITKNDPAATSLLGKPVSADRVDVTDRSNILSLRFSSLQVPVYGPKSSGMLYVWADRPTAQDEWNLYKLELEILDKAGGKLRIIDKNPSVENSPVSV